MKLLICTIFVSIVIVVVGSLIITRPVAAACEATVAGSVTVRDRGEVLIRMVDGAALFVSHMHVNADGSPDAYTPDGNGLSYTCDGAVAYEDGRCVFPGHVNWQQKCVRAYRAWRDSNFTGEHMCVFGFQVQGGRSAGNARVGGVPTIQDENDPIPGNYVSETAMNIPGFPPESQRHYVNSREIPFVVLSRKAAGLIGATLGDVAVVYRPLAGQTEFAIFADIGPSWGLGEGSVALHMALGNNPIVERAGVERAKKWIGDEVWYLVFPNSEVQPTANHSVFRERIDEVAAQRFKTWGGASRLRACQNIIQP